MSLYFDSFAILSLRGGVLTQVISHSEVFAQFPRKRVRERIPTLFFRVSLISGVRPQFGTVS